jgi:uncharacterized protein (TIGR03118 family)
VASLPVFIPPAENYKQHFLHLKSRNMNRNKPTAFFRQGSVLLLSTMLIFTYGCKKTIDAPSPASLDQAESKRSESEMKVGHFTQVNLVANNAEYDAAHVDPDLVNGWGIAFSPTGTPWVNSQGGHMSRVYDREGVPNPGLNPVNIPNPALPTGGNPTGVVFNGTSDFVLPTGGPARFIFVGVDGVVSAWNGAQGHFAFKKFTVPSSAFTGLATGTNGAMNLLYAANFRANMINVWDGSWNAVPMPFMDPNIPAGYAPFNIQNIGGSLYVTYAKVGADGRSEAGVGKGFVDIYRTDGTLIKRFASKGNLNAPWGVAMAPAGWLKDQDEMEGGNNAEPVILVGNFGDGRINAFSADGKYLGQIRGTKGHALVIDGLWAITFAPATSTIDPNRLYFAAGPDLEADGLFGFIIPRPDGDD